MQNIFEVLKKYLTENQYETLMIDPENRIYILLSEMEIPFEKEDKKFLVNFFKNKIQVSCDKRNFHALKMILETSQYISLLESLMITEDNISIKENLYLIKNEIGLYEDGFIDSEYFKGLSLKDQLNFYYSSLKYEDYMQGLRLFHENKELFIDKIKDYPIHDRMSIGKMALWYGEIDFGMIYRYTLDRSNSNILAELIGIENKPLMPKTYDFNDKNVLLYHYGGLGENIFFMRYIKLFKKKYPKSNLHIYLPKSLKELFTEQLPDCYVSDKNEDFIGVAYDTIMGINNILSYIREEITDIRNKKAFIECNISSLPVDRVGINWKGSSKFSDGSWKGINTSVRDIPLEEFSNIIKSNPEINFVVLKDKLTEKEKTLLDQFNNVIIPKIENLYDVKKEIEKTSYVVSVDTSTANLSAGMGMETWVLCKEVPDYRWIHKDKFFGSWVKCLCNKDNNWFNVITDISNIIREKRRLRIEMEKMRDDNSSFITKQILQEAIKSQGTSIEDLASGKVKTIISDQNKNN